MNSLQQVFDQVWETSLSAAVLIGLGWLVIACFRNRLPAWVRYGIWLLVFLRLIVLIAPEAGFSIWNLWKVEKHVAASVVIERSAGYQPAIQQSATLRYEGRRTAVIPLLWIVGAFAGAALALVRHGRLSKWVGRLKPCADPHVLELLDRARAVFGVQKQVVVLINDRFEAPAVFGWRRPCLLLPAAWLNGASREELYGVLLHEVAHVKCRDALLNWIFIFVRSVHWFNPLVWYAFRRLRAERELFCDALVLKRLRPQERAVYGDTLLGIAAQLSSPAAPPTLVPILQHKPEIHRRILMIAKFKPTPWLLSAAFTLLLIALAGLTFTRAADEAAPPAVSAPQDRSKAFDFLERELARQEEIVRKLQSQSSKKRQELAESEPLSAEALQRLQTRRAEAHAEFMRLASLHKYLTNQTWAELRQTINTASPDNQLSELMQQHAMAEQKVADLTDAVASDHPDVKRVTRVLAQINKQIDSRIEGILSGLKARLAAESAHLEALDKEIASARRAYVKGLEHSRPYEESIQELRAQEEILQRMRMRMVQERMDDALERAKRD